MMVAIMRHTPLKRRLQGIASVALIAAFFIATSYFSQHYQSQITQYLSHDVGILAIVLYILICMISVIIPPIASLPLLPAASQVWGGFWAGVMTATGWVAGGVIAVIIARRYGQGIVTRLTSEESLHRAQQYIPRGDKRVFWLIVVLQTLLPVDVLSYAVGLFTRIPLPTYTLATTLGNIPSAFGFAYLGQLSIGWQVAGFALAASITAGGLWLMRRRRAH